ncbi:ADP-ribosyl cyclase/cyclic ADP-ribose hydrolase 2 isoform X3 [Sagmatias obliquidens]|uniref:ADP-ribosyl cyclase/cyclic ADP-ribose hydrolase 2 isoform X3 n=1 Tax=Sagmatias obliquidens TaxID=3371155 RepID=UPI000F440D56|nr:ADP-ribosyl cyclase/cyclic ADP-ribose hydrolase 2 isoform X3 [Lagenorhynchus obliquidens]
MEARGCARSRRPLPALLLILLLPPAAGAAGAADARWSGQGTTPHLQSIFLGRCAEYIAVLSPELRDKNCTAIWEAFKLVLDKDPCSVLPSDYDLFINLSRHSIPRDKSLFWENNHLLVTSYAENGRRFMPLCNVLYGMVGDFLSWCRQKNASGLDYQSCPTSEDCENNPVDSYWKSASIQYAKDSSGVINVMLNGSEPTGAYPVKGFFADFEIPHLQKDKITRIEIWVMHEIGGTNVESCGEGSVKILEERLEKMGFQYSCINDYKFAPKQFSDLMCWTFCDCLACPYSGRGHQLALLPEATGHAFQLPYRADTQVPGRRVDSSLQARTLGGPRCGRTLATQGVDGAGNQVKLRMG